MCGSIVLTTLSFGNIFYYEKPKDKLPSSANVKLINIVKDYIERGCLSPGTVSVACYRVLK